jgi:hypothetical protein
MSVIDPVDCTVMLIRGMSATDRTEVFRQVQDLLPVTKSPYPSTLCCINGKEHKYKAIRETNYLFNFLNKTKFMCSGCGTVRWE